MTSGIPVIWHFREKSIPAIIQRRSVTLRAIRTFTAMARLPGNDASVSHPPHTSYWADEFFEVFTQGTWQHLSPPSFFCMPRCTLVRLGSKPFCEQVSGADDCYLYKCLVLLGPVAYSPAILGAYRIIEGGGSTDKVEGCKRAVGACERVIQRYKELAPASLLRAFETVFASERREYGKRLMGADNIAEARNQLHLSVGDSGSAISILKSLALLSLDLTCLGFYSRFWPPSERVVRAQSVRRSMRASWKLSVV